MSGNDCNPASLEISGHPRLLRLRLHWRLDVRNWRGNCVAALSAASADLQGLDHVCAERADGRQHHRAAVQIFARPPGRQVRILLPGEERKSFPDRPAHRQCRIGAAGDPKEGQKEIRAADSTRRRQQLVAAASPCGPDPPRRGARRLRSRNPPGRTGRTPYPIAYSNGGRARGRPATRMYSISLCLRWDSGGSKQSAPSSSSAFPRPGAGVSRQWPRRARLRRSSGCARRPTTSAGLIFRRR